MEETNFEKGKTKIKKIALLYVNLSSKEFEPFFLSINPRQTTMSISNLAFPT